MTTKRTTQTMTIREVRERLVAIRRAVPVRGWPLARWQLSLAGRHLSAAEFGGVGLSYSLSNAADLVDGMAMSATAPCGHLAEGREADRLAGALRRAAVEARCGALLTAHHGIRIRLI